MLNVYCVQEHLTVGRFVIDVHILDPTSAWRCFPLHSGEVPGVRLGAAASKAISKPPTDN